MSGGRLTAALWGMAAGAALLGLALVVRRPESFFSRGAAVLAAVGVLALMLQGWLRWLAAAAADDREAAAKASAAESAPKGPVSARLRQEARR